MTRRTNRRPEDCEAIVTAVLAGSDRPLTAYDVQDRAAAAGQRLYPTQVYRALDRLIAAGLVRRIETGKAYMLGAPETDAVALCEGCGRAVPHVLGPPAEAVAAALATDGFQVRAVMIEALGRCARCAG